jgi:hypothetical protein
MRRLPDGLLNAVVGGELFRKRCGKAPASELSRPPNRARPESCSAVSFHQAPTLPLKRTPGDGRRAFFIPYELIHV